MRVANIDVQAGDAGVYLYRESWLEEDCAHEMQVRQCGRFGVPAAFMEGIAFSSMKSIDDELRS